MNPMVQTMLGVALRWGITLASGHFLTKGMAEGDVTEISAALIGIMTLMWSMYQKYKTQQVVVTALASPVVMSQKTAEALIANPQVPTPSVTTPKNEVPKPMSNAK